MSLDVHLTKYYRIGRHEDGSYLIERSEVFWRNMTHNLVPMAREAGVYETCWRPEKIDATLASDLIKPLQKGFDTLTSDPDRFRKLNPPNGWGTYEGLVRFVLLYLEACQRYPDTEIRVSR